MPEQTARLVGDELRKNRQVLAFHGGLLDAQIEPRVRLALMRDAQPETLRAYEELVDAHSFDGAIDPERRRADFGPPCPR
jgi:hypothetical protein